MIKYNRYICILLLFLANNISSAGGSLDLPDIGDSSGSIVSPDFERLLGKAFIRNVRKNAKIINDQEVESYITSIGYQLVAHSTDNQLSFVFFVVDSPEINAFAAPGGVIGVNSGIILNSHSESELAAVLAHEIAHVTQRHIARSFEKSNQSTLPSAAALLGSILIGIANPQAGAAALAVVEGTRIQSQINFTRENEKEADNVGMLLLSRAGYNPQGMPAFFERLQKKSSYSENIVPEFLRTHPLTSSRIADSKARASGYPKINRADSISYQLVKARLTVDSYKNPADAVAHFGDLITDSPASRNIVGRYGYALGLTRAGEYKAAEEQLDKLISWEPENIYYMLATANVKMEQRDYPAALEIFQQAYRLYPDYQVLIFAYAQCLLDSNQPALALAVLRNYRYHNEYSPLYYELIAQAEGRNGSEVNSVIAKAEYLYLTGETQLAINRLEQIKKKEGLDLYQKETIDSRISQLEQELELEEQLRI